MYTLGINAAAGSGCACLVRDGRVVAAIQEALPASASMPYNAIGYCLGQAHIAPSALAHVVYAGARPVRADTAVRDASALSCLLQRRDPGLPWQTHEISMQQAREAAACLTSPFAAGAYLVIDDAGTSCGMFDEHAVIRLGCPDRCRTVAALGRPIALHLGLSATMHDALAALAPCGRPCYVTLLRELSQYAAAPDWREVLGPPRLPGQALEQRHIDIAHSFQQVLAEALLDLAAWLHARSGARCLSLGGGAARNYLLAGALRASSPFDEVWVGPSPGDAGTAIGAALLAAARHGSGTGRRPPADAVMGASYTEGGIEQVLMHSGLAYRRSACIAHDTAALLARDRIVAWFQASPEPGGRALLAAPFHHATQERLQDITGRAHLHTGAAMVQEEHGAAWFGAAGASPFQSFAGHVKPALAPRLAGACHVDGSVRLHTVAQPAQPALHQLLARFGGLTGVPVLINAAMDECFFGQGSTPKDALALLASGAADALAIGPFLLEENSLRGP